MKISYVDSGLGNNFGDEIELNRNLIYYPKIHESVLKHELAHTGAVFSFEDLKLDLSRTPSEINSWDIMKFMFKHPKSFSQLLPFYYSSKHGFVYDINLTLIYFVTLCFVSLISFVAFNI